MRGRRQKKIAPVVVAARISATGSARNTAKTWSLRKRGRSRIRGISRITLRSRARKRETRVWPSATKVCWQENCTPSMNIPAA